LVTKKEAPGDFFFDCTVHPSTYLVNGSMLATFVSPVLHTGGAYLILSTKSHVLAH